MRVSATLPGTTVARGTYKKYDKADLEEIYAWMQAGNHSSTAAFRKGKETFGIPHRTVNKITLFVTIDVMCQSYVCVFATSVIDGRLLYDMLRYVDTN